MKYAVLVMSKEVHYQDGTVASHDGDPYWAVREPEGWVEATSTPARDVNKVPADALVFDDEEEAEDFAKRWEGHPWWCQPNGKYEVVPVEPKFRQVFDGYSRSTVNEPQS